MAPAAPEPPPEKRAAERRSRHRTTPTAVAVLAGSVLAPAVVAPNPLSAQQQWIAQVQGGQLQYETGPTATSTSLGFALRMTDAYSSYGLSTGVPLAREDPLWGALDAYRRLELGDRLRYGIDLAGSAFGYSVEVPAEGLPRLVEPGSASGWGLSGETMPFVATRLGAVALEARSGGVWYTSELSGERFDRSVWLSDAALEYSALYPLSVRLVGSYVRATEDAYPYAGATLGYAGSRASLWASVGTWVHDEITTVPWSAGALFVLGDRLSLTLSARREAFDPVFATPARTMWGVGVNVVLAGARTAAEPVPATDAEGRSQIVLADGGFAGPPSVAGDFNDWQPQAMTRRGGQWVLPVELDPGVYNYSFVDDAGEWFVPEGTPGRRPDGMGGWVAVLVVE